MSLHKIIFTIFIIIILGCTTPPSTQNEPKITFEVENVKSELLKYILTNSDFDKRWIWDNISYEQKYNPINLLNVIEFAGAGFHGYYSNIERKHKVTLIHSVRAYNMQTQLTDDFFLDVNQNGHQITIPLEEENFTRYSCSLSDKSFSFSLVFCRVILQKNEFLSFLTIYYPVYNESDIESLPIILDPILSIIKIRLEN